MMPPARRSLRPAPRRAALVLGLAGALVLGLPVAQPRAHPHAWIDVTVRVLFNGDGRVTGLRETWRFDAAYTAFAMAGLGKAGAAPAQADIDAVMHENLSGLASYGYFTKVGQGDAAVPTGAATAAASVLRGRRLEMTFTLPLARPVDPAAGPLDYAIYDPSYYVEMLHAEAEDAVVLDGAPAGCTFHITLPRPSLETIAQAAALDRTQKASDGLGAVFAERVAVRCP
ncbi:MAG: DUF1007 family protein [Rhodobacterales bacterium]|nr:DUF1007 family protein [Rhodobacterales bacterium]